MDCTVAGIGLIGDDAIEPEGIGVDEPTYAMATWGLPETLG